MTGRVDNRSKEVPAIGKPDAPLIARLKEQPLPSISQGVGKKSARLVGMKDNLGARCRGEGVLTGRLLNFRRNSS